MPPQVDLEDVMRVAKELDLGYRLSRGIVVQGNYLLI
jgi:hypothetical protein